MTVNRTILTDVLEHRAFVLEDNMEEPASAQRSDRRFDSMTYTADYLDFYSAVLATWIGSRYSTRTHEVMASFNGEENLLVRPQFLVGRVLVWRLMIVSYI